MTTLGAPNHVQVNQMLLQQMNTDLLGGVSEANGSDGNGDVGALTPDAIVAYVSSQLNSLDGQIKDLMQTQNRANAEVSDLQGVLAKLQKYGAGVGSDNNPDKGACAEMEQALGDEIRKLQNEDPGNPELPKLIQAYNDLVYTGTGPSDATPYIQGDKYPAHTNGPCGDGVINQEEMSAFVNTVTNASQNLGSDAEVNMIQLESVVSKRQTVVQVGTNIVQSLNDTQKAIATNIGH